MHTARENSCRVLAGRYELGRLLGEGGSGRVHAAWDRLSGRHVAVKFTRGAREHSTWRDRARLMREAQALARARHPGVVELLAIHVDEGHALLVLDLIRARSLRGRVLPWPRAARIFARVADALAHVHVVGLAHRDVSPGNVLVVDDDRPILIDFGLARAVDAPTDDAELLAIELSPSESTAGTLAFMAPEQAAGAAPAASADRFSLCATLAAVLGETPDRRVFEALARDPASPAPPELWRTLARGLSEEPEQRFADTSELARSLHAVAAAGGLAGP